MKKLLSLSVLVVLLSLLFSTGVSADPKPHWNKWQPIDYYSVVGEFKFAGDSLFLIREYGPAGTPFNDFVFYLVPGWTAEYFYYNVYLAICAPEGALYATDYSAGWLETITGRDFGDFGFDSGSGDVVFGCTYPLGWHEGQ